MPQRHDHAVLGPGGRDEGVRERFRRAQRVVADHGERFREACEQVAAVVPHGAQMTVPGRRCTDHTTAFGGDDALVAKAHAEQRAYSAALVRAR